MPEPAVGAICATILDDKRQNELRAEIFSKLPDLESERNIISHGTWYSRNQTGVPYHVVAFKKKLRDYEHYEPTLDELAEFTERTKKFTEAMESLALELWQMFRP